MPDQKPQATERGAYKWYVLVLLVLIYIFGAVDRGVISVVAESLREAFDLTDSQIGALGGLAYGVKCEVVALLDLEVVLEVFKASTEDP